MANRHETTKTSTKQGAAPEPPLCEGGCGFYVNETTNNMCSMCYRVKASSPAEPAPFLNDVPATRSAAAAKVPVVAEPKVAPNRCMACRKKVGLLGFTCRCGDTFCSLHRYTDRHACSFDYKKAGRETIAEQNPLVVAPKITKF